MTDDDARTLVLDMEPDDLEELSEYLDVLSSSTKAEDPETIERSPKEHPPDLGGDRDKLREHKEAPGQTDDDRGRPKRGRSITPHRQGCRPVWKYSLVPGGLEAITRSLGLLQTCG